MADMAAARTEEEVLSDACFAIMSGVQGCCRFLGGMESNRRYCKIGHSGNQKDMRDTQDVSHHGDTHAA